MKNTTTKNTTENTTTTEKKVIYTLPFIVSKNGVKVERVATVYLNESGFYKLALNGKEEVGTISTAIMEGLKAHEEALATLKKADIELLNEQKIGAFGVDGHLDNCLVRGFNAYIAKLKAEKKMKDFEGDNIIFRFKEKNTEYKLACTPKYAEYNGNKFIIFKQIDNNAIVALTELDGKLKYIIKGRLGVKAYNGAFKNLQASKLEAFTRTVLNSYFNGKTFNECIELCQKCSKYGSIAIPACLK